MSYLGFDAISTFSEEAINPKKTVGKSILMVVLYLNFSLQIKKLRKEMKKTSFVTESRYPHNSFESTICL